MSHSSRTERISFWEWLFITPMVVSQLWGFWSYGRMAVEWVGSFL